MSPSPELITPRLRLRQWCDADREPFAALNADGAVMRYFPRPIGRPDCDAFIDTNSAMLDSHGWGNWALEVRDSGQFAGFAGICVPPPWHPCAGQHEIGWRLRASCQGFGYATEAASEIVRTLFAAASLERIISCTSAINAPSINVMRKLGMRLQSTFEHPRIATDDPLRPHVVYALERV